jgi:hypothetical protein
MPVQHAAAHLEHAPRVGLTIRVEVALAITDLEVLQTVPLLGHRMKHLARNSDARAQIVSSLVLVRNRCPLTPTKSPKSSNLKMAKSRFAQRVLADVDLDLAPAVRDDQKVRLAEAPDREHAPGVVVLDLVASSSSPVFCPWASTSSAIVFVRVNACGYAVTPSAGAPRSSPAAAELSRFLLLFGLLSSVIAHCCTYRRSRTSSQGTKSREYSFLCSCALCLRAL